MSLSLYISLYYTMLFHYIYISLYINDNPCRRCVGFYLRDGSILYEVTVHVSFTIYITILHYAISLYI